MNFKKTNKVMTFKQKKSLKPKMNLSTELKSRTENKFQENLCKSMNEKHSGKIVDDASKRRKPVAAETAKECMKRQSKNFYDN